MSPRPRIRDGIYRRLHHFIRLPADAFIPSFSLALALFVDPELKIGQIPFADDGGLNLKFYSRGSFQRYSISELIQSQVRLEEGQAAVVPAEKFKDKIVLIGATAPGLLDNRPSPLNRRRFGLRTARNGVEQFPGPGFHPRTARRLQWLLVLRRSPP